MGAAMKGTPVRENTGIPLDLVLPFVTPAITIALNRAGQSDSATTRNDGTEDRYYGRNGYLTGKFRFAFSS